MASTRRPYCKRCNGRFTRDIGSRRVYCTKCSPPRVAPASPALEVPVERPPGEVERVVRKRLADAERDGTVDGVLALRLARQLDDPNLPGAQASSLARQIGDLVDKAMTGVRPEADFVDDLAARRAAVQGA